MNDNDITKLIYIPTIKLKFSHHIQKLISKYKKSHGNQSFFIQYGINANYKN